YVPPDIKTSSCVKACQGSGGQLNSAFVDLAAFELHWRWATNNENTHLNTAFLIINFFIDSIEVGEGTIGDANNLTRLEQSLGLRLVAAVSDAAQDGFSFTISDRRGLVRSTTDEAQHARGILDQVPGSFVDRKSTRLNSSH